MASACAAAAIGLSISLADLSAQAPGQVPLPIPGRNINMVSGTTLPGGDPFLQRQNEPTVAVSTRNPLHILGAANDYRTVDIPGLGEEVIGDAWIGIFKSFDGGSTWKSTLLPGFRQDVIAAGTELSACMDSRRAPIRCCAPARNGLFYLGGMAFNRDQDTGKVFVARYIDNNNLEAGDSIAYLNTSIVDVGTPRPLPRQAVDRGRHSARHEGPRPRPTRTIATIAPGYQDKKTRAATRRSNDNPATNPGMPKQADHRAGLRGARARPQPIPAGNIYVVYSAFLIPPVTQQAAADPSNRTLTARRRSWSAKRGCSARRSARSGKSAGPDSRSRAAPRSCWSRSDDCGATFSRPQQISERTQINQGAVDGDRSRTPATSTWHGASS